MAYPCAVSSGPEYLDTPRTVNAARSQNVGGSRHRDVRVVSRGGLRGHVALGGPLLCELHCPEQLAEVPLPKYVLRHSLEGFGTDRSQLRVQSHLVVVGVIPLTLRFDRGACMGKGDSAK